MLVHTKRLTSILSKAAHSRSSAAFHVSPSLLHESKAWDESKHPRGKNGHWIATGALEDAAGDPEAASKLRERLTPENQAKLSRYLAQSRIERQAHNEAAVKEGRAAGGHEEVQKRRQKSENKVPASHLVNSILQGDRTPETFKKLWSALGALTVEKLKSIKREHGLTASGKNKAELVKQIAERLQARMKPSELPTVTPPVTVEKPSTDNPLSVEAAKPREQPKPSTAPPPGAVENPKAKPATAEGYAVEQSPLAQQLKSSIDKVRADGGLNAAKKIVAEMKKPASPFAADAAANVVSSIAGQHNITPMAEVRKELAKAGIADRKAQDEALIAAMRAGKITGSALEGRHGITEEERANVLNRPGDDRPIGFLHVRAPQATAAPPAQAKPPHPAPPPADERRKIIDTVRPYESRLANIVMNEPTYEEAEKEARRHGLLDVVDPNSSRSERWEEGVASYQNRQALRRAYGLDMQPRYAGGEVPEFLTKPVKSLDMETKAMLPGDSNQEQIAKPQSMRQGTANAPAPLRLSSSPISEYAEQHGYKVNRLPGIAGDGTRVNAGAGFAKSVDGRWVTCSTEQVQAEMGA